MFHSYCCRSPELKKSALRQLADDQPFLTYRHWAGVSPYTLPFGFAETCVLVKQSRSVIYCAHDCSGKGISHRLRPAFVAEFLEPLSPACLGGLPPAHLCRFAVRKRSAPQRNFSRKRNYLCCLCLAAQTPIRFSINRNNGFTNYHYFKA